MILLWGVNYDEPIMSVLYALQRKGAEIIFIDQEKVLQTDIELQLNLIKNTVGGVLKIEDKEYNIIEITAAYLRVHDITETLGNIDKNSKEWRHAIFVESTLSTWAELTNALIINRHSAMASNDSKPYQSSIIREAGFYTPETLITTDSDAVLQFWRHHGTIIYKSISGTRSVIAKFTTEHINRLKYIVSCPTQFQEYIPGNDYRAHIVGNKIFSCEIKSKASDYRYASRVGEKVDIVPFDLPSDIKNKCINVSRALGLIVSGIDLRRNTNGKWYCFEVNPSPAFSYFQHSTGHKIDDAIADILARGTYYADD